MSVAARERIQAAMVELVVDRGYAATTVSQVLARAGVGRAAFRHLFTGKRDCFLRTYEAIAADFSRCVFAASEAEVEWRDGLRAAAYAAAGWVGDHPREIRYATIETIAAGDFARARHQATLRDLVELVDAGREQLERPESVSIAVAEGVIGGAAAMLMKSLRQRPARRGEDLVPELMYVAVRPYLGHAAALEELRTSPPPRRRLELVAEGA